VLRTSVPRPAPRGPGPFRRRRGLPFVVLVSEQAAGPVHVRFGDVAVAGRAVSLRERRLGRAEASEEGYDTHDDDTSVTVDSRAGPGPPRSTGGTARSVPQPQT
jgi:hypothetical protein